MITKHLLSRGFKVFAPGAHKGSCTEPYVVVKKLADSRYLEYSSTITYYDVLCYGRTFSECEYFTEKVKESMKGLTFTVMPTYDITEAFFDEDVGAYMKSITYRNYKKITT